MIATRCAQSADGLTRPEPCDAPPAAPRGNRKPKPRANATTKGAPDTHSRAEPNYGLCARSIGPLDKGDYNHLFATLINATAVISAACITAAAVTLVASSNDSWAPTCSFADPVTTACDGASRFCFAASDMTATAAISATCMTVAAVMAATVATVATVGAHTTEWSAAI